MKKTLSIIMSTLIALIVLDLLVAALLAIADGRGGKAQSLVRYFEYGRSVPGKLERWVENPDLRENLFDTAWPQAGLEDSAKTFMAEPDGMIARGYGMSFLAQLMRSANEQNPALSIDLLGGPAAPPNLSYELFLKDRANRREGDVAVLGILSSSVPAMASFSNRTWLFEQPAPLTYSIYEPDDLNGLRETKPMVATAAQQRSLIRNPSSPEAQDWDRQLADEDRLYTHAAFVWPELDASPFLRLVRRSFAISAISQKEADMMEGGFPYEETLNRMIQSFAEIARADGQTPIVYLIQSRDPNDMDVYAATQSVLEEFSIPYIATVDYADPRDPSVFVGDGHYTAQTNAVFARAFLMKLNDLGLID